MWRWQLYVKAYSLRLGDVCWHSADIVFNYLFGAFELVFVEIRFFKIYAKYFKYFQNLLSDAIWFLGNEIIRNIKHFTLKSVICKSLIQYAVKVNV